MDQAPEEGMMAKNLDRKADPVYRNKIDCEELLGTFLEQEHYNLVIDHDCEVYAKDPWNPNSATESNVVLIFRKNWFTRKEQEDAYDGLQAAAGLSQNRGLAAGRRDHHETNRNWVRADQLLIIKNLMKVPDDTLVRISSEDLERWKAIGEKSPEARGMVWLSAKCDEYDFDFDEWLVGTVELSNREIRLAATWVRNNLISNTTSSVPVNSGIAGWFGRYPRIPYGRATAYTAAYGDSFERSFPFLQRLGKGFEQLLPGRFNSQMSCADRIDSKFRVPQTPFTTITVNRNFRTAAHRDDGDLSSGFSNLTVVGRDKNYKGGLLVLPEIQAAVDIRPGDLLLVNSHEFIHGNTEIVSPDVGELERISLVCYFREDMLDLGCYAYEEIRRQFVEQRRKNKNHALWKNRWNGISKEMWNNQEWFEFLELHGGVEMRSKYHPKEESSSLESFF